MNRGYYKRLYGNKKDNLGKLDQFLEKYNLPKLSHEEIENLNRPITSMKIETVIKIFQQTKAQDQMASQMNSIKHLESSEHLPFWNYEATITLISKPDKDITKKENYRPISLMNIDAKIPNKILAIRIQQHIKD